MDNKKNGKNGNKDNKDDPGKALPSDKDEDKTFTIEFELPPAKPTGRNDDRY